MISYVQWTGHLQRQAEQCSGPSSRTLSNQKKHVDYCCCIDSSLARTKHQMNWRLVWPSVRTRHASQAAKMERQKDTFEERYASKMTKILTKISKETDKARLQAASTKTSPFQVGNHSPGTAFHVPHGNCRNIAKIGLGPGSVGTTCALLLALYNTTSDFQAKIKVVRASCSALMAPVNTCTTTETPHLTLRTAGAPKKVFLHGERAEAARVAGKQQKKGAPAKRGQRRQWSKRRRKQRNRIFSTRQLQRWQRHVLRRAAANASVTVLRKTSETLSKVIILAACFDDILLALNGRARILRRLVF